MREKISYTIIIMKSDQTRCVTDEHTSAVHCQCQGLLSSGRMPFNDLLQTSNILQHIWAFNIYLCWLTMPFSHDCIHNIAQPHTLLPKIIHLLIKLKIHCENYICQLQILMADAINHKSLQNSV